MLKTKTVKHITALILLSVLLFSLANLTSCGDGGVVALSSQGVEFTEDVYGYWYTQLKDYYVSNYGITDTRSFWEAQVPDADYTYAEFIDNKIRNQIDYYLAGNVLFSQYDLSAKLKGTWNDIVDRVDEEIDDGINSFGSRSEYDDYLNKKYGIDSATYRRIKLMEQKFYLVYDYLYNTETGIERATDAEIDAYYTEKYARIKYYMVLKNFEYRLDDEGNRVVNSSGSYVQDALTEAEKKEKAAYATKAFEEIKNGEDIDTYIKKEYPDMLKSAPNGYYVAKSEYYGRLFTNTILDATFEMAIGDTVMCENEDAFFIVQRLDLPSKGYQGTDKNQFDRIGEFAVNDKFEAKFAPIIETIEYNDEVIDRYTVLALFNKKYN